MACEEVHGTVSICVRDAIPAVRRADGNGIAAQGRPRGANITETGAHGKQMLEGPSGAVANVNLRAEQEGVAVENEIAFPGDDLLVGPPGLAANIDRAVDGQGGSADSNVATIAKPGFFVQEW